MHILQHYASMIEQYGLTQGYNTEQSKHTHINLMKDPFQSSNKKDYFMQMTDTLNRQEKVDQFANYLDWRANMDPSEAKIINPGPQCNEDVDSETPTIIH